MRPVTYTEMRAEDTKSQFVKLPGCIIHCSMAMSGWVWASEQRFHRVFGPRYLHRRGHMQRVEEFYLGSGKIGPVHPRIITGYEAIPHWDSGVWAVAW